MRLLIIGDLDGQIGTASKIARDRGAKVSMVQDIDGALAMLCDGNSTDIIMIDVHQDIPDLVFKLKGQHISIPVCACGIEADTHAAVRAIKAGAKEYIPLPPDEELIAAVLEAISEESHSVIHASAKMKTLLGTAEQIAASDASVLITGESGTGKEVIARYIHSKSRRSTKPFISVNCAAIPESLLESELFGHEKGAFTGALSRKLGKFEEANNGTLLLDEISEMDIRLQSKLLRAIQEREIDRVGGSKPVKVDIRLLATSNRNLQEEVAQKNFREDLYFRLNVINLEIPALRERVEDIGPIAEHFIEKYSKANGMPMRPLAEDALAKLEGYHFQGNVRELENIVHRSVIMAQGNSIDAAAILLPDSTNHDDTPSLASQNAMGKSGSGDTSTLVGRSVANVEKELILDTLDHCLGNRTHAANILGISIRTLRNKLKQYSEEGVAS